MKKGLTLILFVCISTLTFSQSATEYFDQAANEYIYKNDQIALNTINTGLAKYPGNTKLRIKFIDNDEGIIVGVSSSLKSVDLSNELFKDFDSIHVKYGLN